jgi:hypothetical protein
VKFAAVLNDDTPPATTDDVDEMWNDDDDTEDATPTEADDLLIYGKFECGGCGRSHCEDCGPHGRNE